MDDLVQAIAVTAELTGARLSEPAALVLAQDLATYPRPLVLDALRRCRRELRTRLTAGEVIARIDDGRPGVEEAWAMIPRDESASVVWTEEMAQAYGVARHLLDDPVAARMAFKESYLRLVAAARDRGEPAKWTPSLGHSKAEREAALLEAVERGRIAIEYARDLVPELPEPKTEVLALVACVGAQKAEA